MKCTPSTLIHEYLGIIFLLKEKNKVFKYFWTKKVKITNF